MNAWMHALAANFQQRLYPAGLLEVLLESAVILLVAAAICLLWRRAAAALRHLVWFVGVGTLPLLLCLAARPHAWPTALWSVSKELNTGNEVSLTLTLMPTARAAQPVREASAGSTAAARATRLPASGALAARVAGSWLALGLGFWAAGAIVGLIWFAAGQLRLRQLGRGAKPVQRPDWHDLLREIRRTLGLRRPVILLQAEGGVMPVTWGWRRPVVLLPTEAADWPVQRRRLVLLHELAHVKRWDCLTQMITRIVCAFFWINPLVWLAARRMCIERERACDDLVLRSEGKASDYAAELLSIARTFRRTHFAAGIAMARSAQLQGRIAALIDPGRVRRMRPRAAVALLAGMGALVGCLAGTSRPTFADSAKTTALRQQQLAQLEAFAAAKERQSLALAAKDGISVGPLYQRCLDAAVKGDVPTVTNLYEYFKRNHGQYARGSATNDVELPHSACWQPVLEVCLAFDHVANCEPKITRLVADGIIQSIPAGSIYFGGTDPGRGLPTAFEKSSIDGDPFFCLTQNALADGTYLDYLQAMYGGKIYTPTREDSQRCFNDYLNDAQRRLEHDQAFPDEPKQIRPGEDVRMVGTNVHVAGQIAVMAINGLMTKIIFDRNPDREFYIEESFPLDWMYPYLEPHGVIMKLNRQPMADLPEEVLAHDHDYWRQVIAETVGNIVDDETSVADLVAAVERVYVRHDLGFTGDPAFIENDYARKMLSKLRSSIAGVYAWRLKANSPGEYQPKTDAARQGLTQQADLALRQTFALCPSSPEAVFRYLDFLVQRRRLEDARRIARTAVDVDPKNGTFKQVLQSLENQQAR